MFLSRAAGILGHKFRKPLVRADSWLTFTTVSPEVAEQLSGAQLRFQPRWTAVDCLKVKSMNTQSCVSSFRRCFPAVRRETAKRSMSTFLRYTPVATVTGPPGPCHSTEVAKGPQFTVPGLAKDSPWDQKSYSIQHPPLQTDTTADVCVIGGGIAGLTTALLLARQNKKVVLLESRCIGAGQTGRTTAHIMTWFDDYYHMLMSMHGQDKAKVVAEVSAAG